MSWHKRRKPDIVYGMMYYLEIKNLLFSYNPRKNAPVLTNFQLNLEKGQRLVLDWPSGQGKTTLLRLIAGFERPQQGTIALAGQLLAGPSFFLPPEKRNVGLVFQDFCLFPHLTVAQNIAYGLFYLNKSEKKIRTQEMLQLIRMEELAARYPAELSGGQKQRVALARTLAPHPKLLLLDEPFSNLDQKLKKEIYLDLQSILSHQTSIIATHHQDFILN